MEKIIETNRLILRKPTIQDANLLLNMSNDKDVEKYVPGFFFPTHEIVINFINSVREYDYNNDFIFVLEEKSSHTIVGMLAADKYTTLEISYLCTKSRRGEGFIPEALQGFISVLKKYYNYQSLIFSIEKNNTSSRNVMKKIKAQLLHCKAEDGYLKYSLSLKELP